MRFALMCASLEPGRDGVGDYVHRVASRLVASGHECLIVALCDPHVAATSRDHASGGGLLTLRLPRAAWKTGDLRAATDALGAFAPRVVSLQLVGYGFDPRGLLWRARERLRGFAGPWQRHLMLHELWIGESSTESVRARVVGRLQRRLLLDLVAGWNASSIHTSNAVYLALLQRAGIRAGMLPLPGNIPVVDAVDVEQERTGLRRSLGMQDGAPALLAAVFGTIHPQLTHSDWLDRLAACCERSGCSLGLLHIGRMGDAGKRAWSSLCARVPGVRSASLGEMDPAAISRVLQAIDLGISASPMALTDKSGAVAAMRDHGLPVCVVRDDYRLRAGSTPLPPMPPGMITLRDDLVERLDALRRDARADAAPERALARIEETLVLLGATDSVPAGVRPPTD